LRTVFTMVSDMEAATRFLEVATGMAPAVASPYWTEFATGDAHVALHLTGAPGAERSDDHAPGSVTIGFDVPDLAAAVARLRQAGWPATDPEVLEGLGKSSSRVTGPANMHLQLVQA
jgi:hypothetical protein